MNSLFIANAHHVVAQQYFVIIDLVDERNCDVARVQYALGSPPVIPRRVALDVERHRARHGPGHRATADMAFGSNVPCRLDSEYSTVTIESVLQRQGKALH
jgi:hypothetical protein